MQGQNTRDLVSEKRRNILYQRKMVQTSGKQKDELTSLQKLNGKIFESYYVLSPVELPYIFCKNLSDFTSNLKILEDNVLFLQVSRKKTS